MRFLPHTDDEIRTMLETIGAASVDELFSSIPAALREETPLDLPAGLPEAALDRHLTALALQNRTLGCQSAFVGAGCYRHYVPAAVQELAARSEFVTPYTPYQPEISQGTLQALFEFQSEICRLFAMEVSNASHYSGATAAADAALMALRQARGKRQTILVSDALHPEYRDCIRTVLGDSRMTLIPSVDGGINRAALADALSPDVAAMIVAYPNAFGVVEELAGVVERVHDAGALVIAAVPEPLALGVCAPPGAWGADIAVGEGQSLGLPPSFGGPTLGLFTVTQKLVRGMPGRVCGRTVDADGRPGYVLTLSTREQHIRREKATSNICSNQALCATTAAIHLALLGKSGFRDLAECNASKAAYAREQLCAIDGVRCSIDRPCFNEFVVTLPRPAEAVLDELRARGILGGVALSRWYGDRPNDLLICVTEMNPKEEIDRYAAALKDIV